MLTTKDGPYLTGETQRRQPPRGAGVAFVRMARQLALAGLAFTLGVARPSLGQTPAAVSEQATAKGNLEASGEYLIGPDDVLSIVFWREQQMSGDVLVRPDGKISLPLLDDVQAAGLAPKQLRDRLVSEARRYMSEPVVTVAVKQINSRKVYITGMVVRPGQYALTQSMTVLQLIATAGGLQEYAKSKDIRVVRVERGQSVTFQFDYEGATKTRPQQNTELKPGDTVVVP